MIHFPYGNSNFYAIRTDGKLYLDRTHHIPLLEEAGEQLLFLRPRRFGKSLLLSMLSHYYDINRSTEFSTLFGDLAIGKAPTSEHNRYLILHWDFSVVSSQGDVTAISRHLFSHLNIAITGFIQRYQQYLQYPVKIDEDNAIASFESLLEVVQNSGQQIYLLIDEYDNFANEVLMQARPDEARYKALLHGEGILKTLFKTIKSGASHQGLGRVFITGVSPVVMSDITSGYNVATNIYLDNEFNALCGITTPELEALVLNLITECQQPIERQSTLETLRVFYSGYRFCNDTTQERVYNPTLCFYFLRHFQKHCEAPAKILDSNLAMDAGKIRYIASLAGGESIIRQVLDAETPLLLEALEDKFGIEALQEVQSGEKFMVSLLYYFGVLTIGERGVLGELAFTIPNLVIRSLYVEELRKRALPDVRDTDAVRHLARHFYQTADLQPLVEFT